MAKTLAGGAPGSSGVVALNRLYLVRHAHAGDREQWAGPDDQRPLSEKGWRQARGLVALLQHEEFGTILSSPSLRCVQTVQPLAEARALPVAEDERLLEGHDWRDTLAWLQGLVQRGSLVACTHGDLVPALLEAAARSGAHLPGQLRWSKGSTWVLEADGAHFAEGHYLPPPS
jgi:8-oxo-dGTP diphosphatase